MFRNKKKVLTISYNKLTNNPEDMNRGQMSRVPIRQGANIGGGGANIQGANDPDPLIVGDIF